MSTVFRVLRYLRRYPGYAAGTVGCALLSTALVIVFPKVTQLIVDEIRAGRGERIWSLVGWAIAAFIARDVLNATRIILNNTFEQKVIFDLRNDLYRHIQLLPLRWFDNRATGDVMTRVMEDVNAVERVLIDGVEQGSVAVLQVFVVAAMLFSYHPGLTWWALTPVPFLAGGALAYTLTAKLRYRGQRKASSAMNALLHDNLAGIRQIKTYVREDHQLARFNEVSSLLQRATLTVMRVWAVYNPTMSFLASFGLTLVIAFGAHAVLRGEMSVGDLTGFLLLTGFLYEPIGRLDQLNQILQAGRAAAERVFEILDEPTEPVDAPNAKANQPLKGAVSFQNISFSYRPELPVLQNITLDVLAGKTLALVGETGAGKSTIVQLLIRFYEFEQGNILLDGTPIRELSRAALRNAVG
ncbi:MAG: ABC transporter ATP-binding protein, partial [Verrucomicrobiota bacterium]